MSSRSASVLRLVFCSLFKLFLPLHCFIVKYYKKHTFRYETHQNSIPNPYYTNKRTVNGTMLARGALW